MNLIARFSTAFTMIFFTIIFSSRSSGQTGWKWGLNCAGGQQLSSLVKTDSAGNVFTAAYCYYGYSYVFGTCTVPNPGLFSQLVVAKTSSTGHYLWAVGTDSSDASPVNIAADRLGNLYVLGMYDSSICRFGPCRLLNPLYKRMYFLSKISPAGSVIWAKNISGYGDMFSSWPNIGYMDVDDSGNVYTTGVLKDPVTSLGSYTFSNHDPSGLYDDFFIAKHDSAGNLKWASGYGGRKNDMPAGFAVSPSGNVYMPVIYESDTIFFGSAYIIDSAWRLTNSIHNLCLLKTDRNGNILFDKKITTGSSIYYSNIALDAAENLYMAGWTRVLTDHFYMSKYNSSGNFVWLNYATGAGGGSSDDEATSVAVDLCGHVWAGGYIGDNMKIGTDTLFMPSGFAGMFIVGYDTSGAYISGSGKTLNTGVDGQYAVAVDNWGNLYANGDFDGYFTPLEIGLDTLSGPIRGLFVGKYTYDTTFCIAHHVGTLITEPLTTTNEITIYPNPAHTALTIASTGQPLAEITITNLLGQSVKSAPDHFNGEKVLTINISDLPPGIYFVRINGTDVRKFVKE